MSRLDELNNDRKNLKTIVELSEKMRDTFKQLKCFNEEAINRLVEASNSLRQKIAEKHNEVIQQIAIEQHGIK